jgi:hypothetical protein
MKVSATNYIRGQIKILQYDLNTLAGLLNMSVTTLCRRINEPTSLKGSELSALARYLEIPDDKLGVIIKGEKIEI